MHAENLMSVSSEEPSLDCSTVPEAQVATRSCAARREAVRIRAGEHRIEERPASRILGRAIVGAFSRRRCRLTVLIDEAPEDLRAVCVRGAGRPVRAALLLDALLARAATTGSAGAGSAGTRAAPAGSGAPATAAAAAAAPSVA